MRDARPLLLAILLATPFACSHENPDAKSPTRGSAGSTPGPAPTTTDEPVAPGAPEAVNGSSPALNAGPRTFDASGTSMKSNGIAQPVPPHGTGGTIGTGGTLGTGGTGSGGIGPGAGTGGISTGGTIVH